MATDKWKLAGIHGVRRYIWSLLQNELGWKTSDYKGLVPLVTAQQQPEFAELGKPYIVYNYSHVNPGEQFWVGQEMASFEIYSVDEQDVREVINLLEEYFEALDDSAKLLNHWIAVNGTDENKKYDYKWTRVVSTVGAVPAGQEGGLNSGNIAISYAYTRTSRVDFGVGPYVTTPAPVAPEPTP